MPYREEDEKRHLKVTGDLGQIVPLVRSPSFCEHFTSSQLKVISPRNGTYEMKRGLPNVSVTLTSYTTSSDENGPRSECLYGSNISVP